MSNLFSSIVENDLKRFELKNDIQLSFPNGASARLPRDILMMFECDTIRDASPTFISSTMLVYTEENTLKWKELFSKEKAKVIKMLKKKPFVDFELYSHFETAFKDFVVPFIGKLCETKLKTADFWKMKSLTVRLFKLLDGLLANMVQTERDLRKRDDPIFLPIKTKGESISLNLCLMSLVWTFGAILDQDMRRRFEDTFLQYRRKFDLNLSGSLTSGGLGLSKNTKVSLFEMYFDLERLQWDLVAERIGTRVSEGYQSKNNQIIIPSLEMSQGMLLFDILMTNRNYNIQIEGKSACQKTTVLTNISHKLKREYRSIWIPMTISNTIEKSRKVYEQFYKTSENRFIMTPIDSLKPLFIIDDLHLEENTNSSFSDFFRMWDIYGGYYHLENGHFANFEELRLMCSVNPSAMKNKNKVSRLSYYINTIYFDELDNDRFRIFIQNWLTNRSWNTSKLVNKFYILITNSLMSIKEKMQKEEEFSCTQDLKIHNFHNFVKFLYNFSNFTLMINDDATVDEKEEMVVAQILAFELASTFGDRIMFPSIKNNFLLKIQEICKHNFLIPSISPNKIKSYVYGNFHELHKQPSSFVYKKYSKDEFKSMSKDLCKGLKLDTEKSCGYLQAYLESPGILRQVYKIARLLVTRSKGKNFQNGNLNSPSDKIYKKHETSSSSKSSIIKDSHLFLVGAPRVCGRELLQLATLIHPNMHLFEPEVMMSSDFVGFKNSLREAMLLAIRSDKDIVFFYDTNHLDDPIYVDYIYNYISLFDRDSIEMFDKEFCDQLISAERENMKNKLKQFPSSKNLKLLEPLSKAPGGKSKDIYAYESEKNHDYSDNELYTLAISKLSCQFHIVVNASGIKDYKEINKYSSLESKMTVMFLEDIVNEDCHLFTTDDIETTNKTNFNMFDLSYDSFTRMQLQNPIPQGVQESYQDTEVEIDRKNKQLAKIMIDMKSKIHNSILDFYKVVIIEDPDDEVAPGIPSTIIPSPDMKLEMISGLINKNIKVSPYLDIPMSVNYNSKFVILHEMIKFMHDFMSTSLMMRNNYYESLVEKSNDLSEFYESTVVRKKDLHSKNHTVTVQMLDLQDQISRVDSQLDDIRVSINTNIEKKKQQAELEKEVEKVLKEKDRRIKKIVHVIEQTTGADYEFVLKNTKYGSSEDFLIKTLGKIINEDAIGFRNRQELEILFSNSTHL